LLATITTSSGEGSNLAGVQALNLSRRDRNRADLSSDK
jgi:hypothetical protein